MELEQGSKQRGTGAVAVNSCERFQQRCSFCCCCQPSGHFHFEVNSFCKLLFVVCRFEQPAQVCLGSARAQHSSATVPVPVPVPGPALDQFR